MRIAINTRFLLSGKLEGIGMYTQEIFKRVVQQMPEHEFYFLFDRPFSEEFIFAKNVTPIVVSPPARHPFLWYWWFEKSIPKILKKYNIDLFISPDGYCSLNTTIPQILTIHDLGFEHFPMHVPFLVRKYYQYFTPRYCEKAAKILTVSQFTKNDIVEKYGIVESKIDVIYNGVDIGHEVNVVIQKSIENPYFIFIGAVHPRKNVLNLLKSFEIFKSKYNNTHQLIIIGRSAWMNAELENYLAEMKFKKDVIWIENCERNKLLDILQNAVALVYPSLFEGFGIPIIEAMSVGVPVITSNTSAMAEISGNATLLVNPTNTNEIADAMQLILSDEILRTDFIEKGKTNAVRFPWQQSGEKVMEIIRKFHK
ncbi:MAG TPA: glycosyltransferase family 1 protein [Chitinophagales bacterium]|nr:glycosyltransferase family 1 protein [Chitinophagales bacterium]